MPQLLLLLCCSLLSECVGKLLSLHKSLGTSAAGICTAIRLWLSKAALLLLPQHDERLQGVVWHHVLLHRQQRHGRLAGHPSGSTGLQTSSKQTALGHTTIQPLNSHILYPVKPSSTAEAQAGNYSHACATPLLGS